MPDPVSPEAAQPVMKLLTRWDKWYAQDNLDKDARILAAPPSLCAQNAAREFLSRGKRRVLDLACGVGRDTFYLVERGLDVTGVDASLNGLRAASQIRLKHNLSAVLTAADARRLPFKAGSFEGVYCFGLLHEQAGLSHLVWYIYELSQVYSLSCCL
jgi:SAM-dependent methyltransferase